MAKPLEGGGDHGLEVVLKNDNAEVDIIAVHGLGADSRFSWRYQPRVDGKVLKDAPVVNWLKDEGMLPSEMPNARVLCFNYFSNWAPGTKGTVINVWALGEELMREIFVEREGKTEREKHRPIIFIGHSFGGIVIEQGIVLACATMSPYKLVPRCTVGIITLGVPHQGSASAAWGTTITRLGDILSLGGDATLISALKEGSTTLPNIVKQFLMWVGRYSVDLVQFYETEKTNYGARMGFRWNEMVVPQSSACLDPYDSIPLPSDHLKMAKYDGPHNPSYKKVMPVLKKMASNAPEKGSLRFEKRTFVQDNSMIPAVHLECQKALFVSWPISELEGIKRRLGERTAKTCEWLLSKPEYTLWLTGQRPQVMRLVGLPGMGKSMMITFLIEQLTEKLEVTPDMVLAYHFCDNRNQSSNTAQAVVRMMLFQLFQQRPKHFHFLQKAYDIQGNKLFQDFHKMWEIFLDVLKHYGEGYSSSEAYLLIDALDECDEDSRKSLMEGLARVAASTTHVRIFFTCRPEDDIESHHSSKAIKTISCHIGLDDLNGDIELFIQDKVPKLCERRQWGEPEKIMISLALRKKANGIFLWCAFVLEDIEKVRMADIPKTLESLPTNLTEVYQRITKAFRKEDKNVAKMVLEIVCGARRPLKMDELTMTYVLAEDCPKDHRWEKKQMPNPETTRRYQDSFTTCGRLLRKDIPTDTINLVHQSAKDFLLDEYLRTPTQKANEKTNVRLNNLFLELIFRYFTLTDFDHLQYRMVFDAEWNIDWESSWWEMDPSPPFMVYCGREWELHCKDAENHRTDGMDRFIKYITYRADPTDDDSDEDSDDNDAAHGEEKNRAIKVLNPRTSVLNSWLRKVAISGNKKFVGFLLKKGAVIDAADFRGWTALPLAARAGQAKVIDFLVKEKHADLNALPPHIDGRTPVQTAAEEGKVEILKKLLELKADINQLPAKINGRTALQAAAEKGLGDTVQFLVDQQYAEVDPNVAGAEVSGVTALLAAAGSGGEWQMGKNIHRTIKQRSRLPGSAEIDTQKIAEEDQQDREQRRQEETNHERVVSILVKANAKLIPNQFNWTALHAAVERESDDMVDAMLEQFTPQECHVRGCHDGTPLHSAKAKANEELANKIEAKGCTEDYCTYSKLDLDAMMKYIRAVLTRLMIQSNTERFFFIQSYIPIYHVIYSYCAEGADDQDDHPPVEQGGRRGELVYRGVDAWLKSYVKWNQKFIDDTPKENDFLTVYLREWKLFKRGAYYVGRMLRYLTRHWVKHQRDELNHRDLHEIADLFFHRWRTGMTSEVRRKVKAGLQQILDEHKDKAHNDQRAKEAIMESLNIGANGKPKDFKDIFEAANEYFDSLGDLKWDEDENFEVQLRHLSDEFEVERQIWISESDEKKMSVAEIEAKVDANKRKILYKMRVWKPHFAAATDIYLNKLEPLFLARYSGGKTEEIRQHVDALWDILRDDNEGAKKRRARNEKNAQANADIGVKGGNSVEADGDVAMKDGPNGIKPTPLGQTTV